MTPPDPFRPNQLIPGTNYRYLRVLGEGGQGIVVLAADDFLQTEVVIKFVHASHAPYLSTRIRDEARTLARLKHPGIVRVLGGGMTAEEQPRGYFVMERLEGDTLYAVLRRQTQRLPVHLCLEIVMSILEALDYAHSAPHSIIHRDLKPGNIFMARVPPKDTQPIVLDFGLAQLFEESSKVTGRRFVGTLEYAAPEQLLGKSLSPRTDLYAMGLILFELVAGRHPFGAAIKTQDRAVIARALLEDTAPRLSTLGFDLDPALDELVFSSLAKDPASRPRSAHDFLTKLKAIHTRLEMLHPEPKSHDKTEEEPLETLWARMGIRGAAPSAPSLPASGGSKPLTHTAEMPVRVVAPVPPSREALVRAKTSPAPTEELPQTRHHAAAMKRFRAADTATAPGARAEASHAPVVRSAAQRLVDRHGNVLYPLLGAFLAVPVVFAIYELGKTPSTPPASAPVAPAAAVAVSGPALPSVVAPTPTVAPAAASASAHVPPVARADTARAAPTRVAPLPVATRPRAPAAPTASAKPNKLPGSGLDDVPPAPSNPPPGYDLLK